MAAASTPTLCSDWITGDDVALCCQGDYGTDSSVFDMVAESAQQILFELSGRLFPGVCETTVRPCRTGCACPWQVLSRGHIVWNPYWLDPLYGYGWWGCGDGEQCGCAPLSRVLLAGQVIEVTEVRIDGDIVDPATYRVDNRRWLTRLRDPADPNIVLRWPGCQNLDLAPGEDGTWEVDYTYGVEVPSAGEMAASELACELYKQCNAQPCALPTGTTRATRPGVIIERPAFTSWGFEKGGRTRPRGWNTGMPLVDLFLNTYNGNGLSIRPIFWSPSLRGRYAQTYG